MKALLLAFVAVGVIAVVANFALGVAGFDADERTAGTAVRLDG